MKTLIRKIMLLWGWKYLPVLLVNRVDLLTHEATNKSTSRPKSVLSKERPFSETRLRPISQLGRAPTERGGKERESDRWLEWKRATRRMEDQPEDSIVARWLSISSFPSLLLSSETLAGLSWQEAMSTADTKLFSACHGEQPTLRLP